MIALLRRSICAKNRAPHGISSGESELRMPCVSPVSQAKGNSSSVSSENHSFTIYSINIQCLFAHLSELCCQLQEHEPDIVFIQETWLDASTESFTVPGYKIIARRDRGINTNRGGILTLCKSCLNTVVHIHSSGNYERMWHYIHTDIGCILLCNWYRSDFLPHDNFTSFVAEFEQYSHEAIANLVAGDLNIHHKKWQRYSNANTGMGQELQNICGNLGLVQQIGGPTRNEYLLDLLLSDIHGISNKILHAIADHRSIMASVPFKLQVVREIRRSGWVYNKAKWQALIEALVAYDWSALARGTAEEAAMFFQQSLTWHLQKFIPRRTFTDKKQSLPWLNEECAKAVAYKNQCEGTPLFESARNRCSEVLNQAYSNHVQLLKQKIAALPRGSKQWWRLNIQLLHKKCKSSSVPPLKVEDEWILEPTGKANAFAQAWLAKSALPDEHVDCIYVAPPEFECDNFCAMRTRFTFKLMQKLDSSKATGSDLISAFIIKRIAKAIAGPFTRLCRRLFHEACWPKIWQVHMLCPIYKRASVYHANNYRGVHLTSILSKIAEHIIGKHLVAFLQSKSFGQNQWAYSKGRSARDLITLLCMSWILEICKGNVIGAYLSDIAAAFDRVFKEYMIAKLHTAGVGETFLRFLDAYLQPRVGRVVVEGAVSDKFDLKDTVFQGTVFGPWLWNVFFADVCIPASSTGGQEAMFADDLNVFQVFPRSHAREDILATLQICRQRVHQWGKSHRVVFDASKEHLQIIHPLLGFGHDFKLLGCTIDVKLTMEHAIDDLLMQARPKMKAILRTRAHYDVPNLIMQFKTHIWGIIESRNGGICHASTSHLNKLDSFQRGFLHELGLNECQAFLQFNFAPPTLRRDIGILGFLHKRVLGLAHPKIEAILPFFTCIFPIGRMGHSKQLYSHFDKVHFQIALWKRSIFGQVDIYNNLPQAAVDCNSVPAFQSYLTHLARTKCEAGLNNWQFTFNTRSRS